ncbi:hypothetical protein IG631_09547 [Alternaria alternata]|nr:hypothetical protein IG631_09547 [Alternaria alternata]
MPPKSLPSHPQVDKLLNAIDSATASRLRAVLKSLCVKDKANFAYVQDALLVQPGVLKRAWSEQDEDGDDDDDDEYESEDSSEDVGAEDESEYSDSEPNAPASRQRFEICIQCDKEYDVLQNHKRSCEWHDGKSDTRPLARRIQGGLGLLSIVRFTRGRLGRRLLGRSRREVPRHNRYRRDAQRVSRGLLVGLLR